MGGDKRGLCRGCHRSRLGRVARAELQSLGGVGCTSNLLVWGCCK